MSAWRKKFVATFPAWERELYNQFTPYFVFRLLLEKCRQAHEQGNEAELRKIYDFAAWCHRHKAKDLSNAAGVSFYEHLGDYAITRQNLPRTISPDIFRDISGLLEWSMGAQNFAKLKADYENYHQSRRERF